MLAVVVILGGGLVLLLRPGSRSRSGGRQGHGSTVADARDAAAQTAPRTLDAGRIKSADAAVAPRRVDAAPPRPTVDPEALKQQVAQAKALLAAKKDDEALKLLQAVLAADSNQQEAIVIIGEYYYKQTRAALEREDYKKAAAAGHLATRYAPQNADAWMSLGYSLVALKQTVEARQALTRYLELCPKCQWSPWAKQTLAGLK